MCLENARNENYFFQQTLAKDSKGAAKLASKVLDETDSNTMAAEAPLASGGFLHFLIAS